MNTESYDDVLRHALTHALVREGVRTAMESPLREPILEGVEGSGIDTGSDGDDVGVAESSGGSEAGGRSLSLTAVVLLAVVIAVLYGTRRRGDG